MMPEPPWAPSSTPSGAALWRRHAVANQYLAYETLSDGMKKDAVGLRALHSTYGGGPPGQQECVPRHQGARGRRLARDRERAPGGGHASRDGRKLLYVNASYTVGFEGMTEAESKPLLGYLLEHGHRPEFTCRFRWETGSIAFWDNRVCKHLAIHDAGPFRRVMRRTQIAGGPMVERTAGY
jgi:taurine dioxygenase